LQLFFIIAVKTIGATASNLLHKLKRILRIQSLITTKHFESFFSQLRSKLSLFPAVQQRVQDKVSHFALNL